MKGDSLIMMDGRFLNSLYRDRQEMTDLLKSGTLKGKDRSQMIENLFDTEKMIRQIEGREKPMAKGGKVCRGRPAEGSAEKS
jgi:hypothetical protein|tara:strand:- start:406 stop:651 length:246 start_codon:yes stop_codon:yes gene_type:complete